MSDSQPVFFLILCTLSAMAVGFLFARLSKERKTHPRLWKWVARLICAIPILSLSYAVFVAAFYYPVTGLATAVFDAVFVLVLVFKWPKEVSRLIKDACLDGKQQPEA
jgi:formate-dependent nitrite reductase membrane component NrfD